jgi:hypothetical protein
MTIADAIAETGMSYTTINREINKGSFEADKPRGNRGGWQIDARSLRMWLVRRKIKTGNGPARAAARRELAEMGAL